MNAKPTAISVFSGCGGIDLGFNKAGYEVLYSTDHWGPACRTLEANELNGIVECKDIREIDFKQVLENLSDKDVDCLIGGPPCPPYSKSRFYLKDKKRALEDSDSYTLAEYFRAVEEIRPKAFFFENVHGFFYRPHAAAFEYLKTMSKKLGYKITYGIVNAAFYGVPQTRERFICVGVRDEFPKFIFPDETHYNPSKHDSKKDAGKTPWVTCKEAIGDLDFDLPEDKNMQAGSKHKNLLKQIPPGDNYLFFTEKRGHPNPKFKWRARYWSFLLKLSPDRPSWTIQASHSNNMGPFHWKNRFLRIPEIKRLQSFDDAYNISGSYKEQWRQVGNAVPPKLVKEFATEIIKQILEETEKRRVNNLKPLF